MNTWQEFWQWAISNYLYQAIVLLFVIGFCLFKLLQTTKFSIGKGGLTVERNSKDLVVIVNKILDEVEDLRSRVIKIENTLQIHYGYIRNAVVQSGIGVGWSDKGAPYDETVKALLMNLSLGENGNHESRLVDVVIGRGKEGIRDFNSKLNDFIRANKDRLDDRFYESIRNVSMRLV